jgi:hypothetical protein
VLNSFKQILSECNPFEKVHFVGIDIKTTNKDLESGLSWLYQNIPQNPEFIEHDIRDALYEGFVQVFKKAIVYDEIEQNWNATWQFPLDDFVNGWNAFLLNFSRLVIPHLQMLSKRNQEWSVDIHEFHDTMVENFKKLFLPIYKNQDVSLFASIESVLEYQWEYFVTFLNDLKISSARMAIVKSKCYSLLYNWYSGTTTQIPMTNMFLELIHFHIASVLHVPVLVPFLTDPLEDIDRWIELTPIVIKTFGLREFEGDILDENHFDHEEEDLYDGIHAEVEDYYKEHEENEEYVEEMSPIWKMKIMQVQDEKKRKAELVRDDEPKRTKLDYMPDYFYDLQTKLQQLDREELSMVNFND